MIRAFTEQDFQALDAWLQRRRTGWRELSAGGEVRMHTKWSVQVAPAVRRVYAFWLPRQRAQIPPGDDEGRLH